MRQQVDGFGGELTYQNYTFWGIRSQDASSEKKRKTPGWMLSSRSTTSTAAAKTARTTGLPHGVYSAPPSRSPQGGVSATASERSGQRESPPQYSPRTSSDGQNHGQNGGQSAHLSSERRGLNLQREASSPCFPRASNDGQNDGQNAQPAMAKIRSPHFSQPASPHASTPASTSPLRWLKPPRLEALVLPCQAANSPLPAGEWPDLQALTLAAPKLPARSGSSNPRLEVLSFPLDEK